MASIFAGQNRDIGRFKFSSCTIPHTLRIFLLLLTLQTTVANAQQLMLITSGNSKVYNAVASKIISELKANCPSPASNCTSIKVSRTASFDRSTLAKLHLAADINLLVTVGLEAAIAIRAERLPIPQLYTVIPRAATSTLNLQSVDRRVSAVYIDQPVDRLFRLIELIRPADQEIRVLLGPDTRWLQQSIQSAAGASNITVKLKQVTQEREIGPAMRELLDNHQFLLTLPDPLIYNRKNIRNILLFSYYNQIPVIGFSEAYVRAGAMISLYSSPSDIGRHVAEIVRETIDREKSYVLPPPADPKYFTVSLNDNVSKALGFSLDRASDITSRLQAMENP